MAPTRVAIIGAGGHGQVVADAALEAQSQGQDLVVSAFVDQDARLRDQSFFGVRVFEDLQHAPHDQVVVAIGDNRRRAEVFRELRASGERFYRVVHPSAVVARSAHLAEGVMVLAGAVVNPHAAIGENTILNTHCSVDHHSTVAMHGHVAPGVHLGGNVDLGEGVFVGIGAIVMPGRSVGDWAVVGAGAAVTTDVAAHTTVVGVPARPIEARR